MSHILSALVTAAMLALIMEINTCKLVSIFLIKNWKVWRACNKARSTCAARFFILVVPQLLLQTDTDLFHIPLFQVDSVNYPVWYSIRCHHSWWPQLIIIILYSKRSLLLSSFIIIMHTSSNKFIITQVCHHHLWRKNHIFRDFSQSLDKWLW